MVEQSQGTLLLVLPTLLYRCGTELYYDRQAHNGLRLWLENFEHVILSCQITGVQTPPPDTVSMQDMQDNPALRLEPLNEAWHPLLFFRYLPSGAVHLWRVIDRSNHLLFAIGGFFGDWASLGALLAAVKGRKGVVWTDRVESEVMAFQAASRSGLRGLYHRLLASITRRYERLVISRSAMGLFHGADTFAAYAPYSRKPYLVHDIHLGPEARISARDLAEKAHREARTPLQIVYAGRVHPDKGVDDWISVLDRLRRLDVPFDATWFGDGPYFDYALEKVRQLNLTEMVHFPGATSDRAFLIQTLRQADIFLFCHQTPESPRCLIEALLSGTPIIGYDTPFPRDLINQHQGGDLVPLGEIDALAQKLCALWADRRSLGTLFTAAARDGYPHVDVDVFRHRSQLIKSLIESNEK
jgi:colanic acid/amylovoran biosynthesis glycosyltransferase